MNRRIIKKRIEELTVSFVGLWQSAAHYGQPSLNKSKFPSHGKLQNGCPQQTTIQVFLKQKWVHLFVLYAKHIVHPSVLRMNTAVFTCKTGKTLPCFHPLVRENIIHRKYDITYRKTDKYTVYMDTNQSQKAESTHRYHMFIRAFMFN